MPGSPAEIHLHQQAVGGVPGAASLPDPQGTSQRLLRLAGRAEIRTRQGISAPESGRTGRVSSGAKRSSACNELAIPVLLGGEQQSILTFSHSPGSAPAMNQTGNPRASEPGDGWNWQQADPCPATSVAGSVHETPSPQPWADSR